MISLHDFISKPEHSRADTLALVVAAVFFGAEYYIPALLIFFASAILSAFLTKREQE